eukprot:GILK01003060.1.p1 GENE.GILK01003060.1~~GILK01003060.1.p1  ORF type:complete len:513 (+),score=32.62 GILK01003060.1:55-1539(+)
MALVLASTLLCFITAVVANPCTVPSSWSGKNLALLAERKGFDSKPWRIIVNNPGALFGRATDWNIFPDRLRSEKENSNPQAKRVITNLKASPPESKTTTTTTTSCAGKFLFHLQANVDGKNGFFREHNSILSFYPDTSTTTAMLFWGECPAENSGTLEIYPVTVTGNNKSPNCILPARVIVYKHGGNPRLVLQNTVSNPEKALQLSLEVLPTTADHTKDCEIPNFLPPSEKPDRIILSPDNAQHILDAGVFLQAVKAGNNPEVKSDESTPLPLSNLVHLVWRSDGYQFRVNPNPLRAPWLPTTFLFQAPELHGMRPCAEGKTPDGKRLTCPFRNDHYLDMWLYDAFAQSLPAIDKVKRSGQYELIPHHDDYPSLLELHSLPSERVKYSRAPLTHGQTVIIREQNKAGSSHLLCASVGTEPAYLYFKYFDNPVHLEEDQVVESDPAKKVNPDPACQFRVLRRSLIEKPNDTCRAVGSPDSPTASADGTTTLSGQA